MRVTDLHLPFLPIFPNYYFALWSCNVSLAAPVVEGCLTGGLNGLIMAYGQTSSGKSHTMGVLQGLEPPREEKAAGSTSTEIKGNVSGKQRAIGEEIRQENTPPPRITADACSARNEPGIIPRALSRVFEHVGSAPRGPAEVLVKVSLLQIYNETVQVSRRTQLTINLHR